MGSQGRGTKVGDPRSGTQGRQRIIGYVTEWDCPLKPTYRTSHHYKSEGFNETLTNTATHRRHLKAASSEFSTEKRFILMNPFENKTTSDKKS